jgi:hypothetical protein
MMLSVSLTIASPIAYVSYYDSSSCKGNPYAILPVFQGDYTFQYINGGDCIQSLAGNLGSVYQTETDTFTGADSKNIYITVNGKNQTRAFGSCQSSTTYNGCSNMYTSSAPTLSSSGNTIKDAGFVGFLNYQPSCPDNSVTFRAPAFDGVNNFCIDTSQTTCVNELRGYVLPDSDSNRLCNNNIYAAYDSCFFDVTDSGSTINYGECTNSNTFDCEYVFNLDSGYYTSATCNGNGSSSSSASTLSTVSMFSLLLIFILFSFF